LDSRTIFPQRALPAALVAPQLLLTGFFFLWPAAEAVWSSLTLQDPFGQQSVFVGFDNFAVLFADPLYRQSILRTLGFCAAVSALSMSVALLLAVFTDRAIRGRAVYRTLLIWPYAVAPAIAAVLWLFLLSPRIGLLGRWLNAAGLDWNYYVNGLQALLIVVLASAWKQVSYNFIFFLAGLQAIPRSVIEAAAIDGAGVWQRIRRITMPQLRPVNQVLVLVLFLWNFNDFNTPYVLFGNVAPKQADLLSLQIYDTSFESWNFGSGSAMSVLLLLFLLVVTAGYLLLTNRRTRADV
jgi:sn-glycerol 3-phosphate transport system permease protein